MVKLQKIRRANGSIVSSINLPLEFIEKLQWVKGDEIKIELSEENSILLKKEGSS